MNYTFGNINAQLNIPGSVEYNILVFGDITQHVFQVKWDKKDVQPGMKLRLFWSKDIIDFQYHWHSTCGNNRNMLTNWHSPVKSKISSGSPLHCFYNDAGRNRYTVALDDGVTEISRSFGIREEDATLECYVDIPLDATGVTEKYDVTLYIDETDCRYEDAVRRVADWWEAKYPPMNVPGAAKAPLYSFWYSFHQNVPAAEVEAECARAAAMGMKTVIVDDGWQTGDGNRGYAYCGDWEPYEGKIPDMAAHVKKVHDMGLKYMLWYSVPFVGKHSKAAKLFADKSLSFEEGHGAYVVDPRYPEVREYLINIYKKALIEWDLDGFKLDFIDSFRMKDATPLFREGMDHAVLEDAVHTLMVDVMKTLTAIKPDILIEFRQSYIGPVMREFGNMLRVGDCPLGTAQNRIGVVDLRLTSGNTAVHSDMLMWHENDNVENGVIQVQNCIFSTVQMSVRLDKVPENHKKAIAFWTQFMEKETDLLQNAPIYAEAPQNLYSLARTEKDGRSVIAVYEKGHSVRINPAIDEMYIINANSGGAVIMEFGAYAGYDAKVYDCTGELTAEGKLEATPITKLPVPMAGFVHLKKI